MATLWTIHLLSDVITLSMSLTQRESHVSIPTPKQTTLFAVYAA
jgi:hypothetical protein